MWLLLGFVANVRLQLAEVEDQVIVQQLLVHALRVLVRLVNCVAKLVHVKYYDRNVGHEKIKVIDECSCNEHLIQSLRLLQYNIPSINWFINRNYVFTKCEM